MHVFLAGPICRNPTQHHVAKSFLNHFHSLFPYKNIATLSYVTIFSTTWAQNILLSCFGKIDHFSGTLLTLKNQYTYNNRTAFHAYNIIMFI